jgi:hypothetical protein
MVIMISTLIELSYFDTHAYGGYTGIIVDRCIPEYMQIVVI